jgi:hypothetical protein
MVVMEDISDAYRQTGPAAQSASEYVTPIALLDGVTESDSVALLRK